MVKFDINEKFLVVEEYIDANYEDFKFTTFEDACDYFCDSVKEAYCKNNLDIHRISLRDSNFKTILEYNTYE